jgi:hypothetical protein
LGAAADDKIPSAALAEAIRRKRRDCRDEPTEAALFTRNAGADFAGSIIAWEGSCLAQIFVFLDKKAGKLMGQSVRVLSQTASRSLGL